MKAADGRTERPLLLALVAVLALLPVGIASGDEPEDSSAADMASSDTDRQIILYYMHGARRCKTCRSIEAYAKGVVTSRFSEDLESGALEWKVVDFDKPENQHFIEEFGLFTSSLVVVVVEQGEVLEFEVLQEAWSLVRDKTRFQQYVYRALREHLS